jgi:hypothetical protein
MKRLVISILIQILALGVVIFGIAEYIFWTVVATTHCNPGMKIIEWKSYHRCVNGSERVIWYVFEYGIEFCFVGVLLVALAWMVVERSTPKDRS